MYLHTSVAVISQSAFYMHGETFYCFSGDTAMIMNLWYYWYFCFYIVISSACITDMQTSHHQDEWLEERCLGAGGFGTVTLWKHKVENLTSYKTTLSSSPSLLIAQGSQIPQKASEGVACCMQRRLIISHHHHRAAIIIISHRHHHYHWSVTHHHPLPLPIIITMIIFIITHNYYPSSSPIIIIIDQSPIITPGHHPSSSPSSN